MGDVANRCFFSVSKSCLSIVIGQKRDLLRVLSTISIRIGKLWGVLADGGLCLTKNGTGVPSNFPPARECGFSDKFCAVCC